MPVPVSSQLTQRQERRLRLVLTALFGVSMLVVPWFAQDMEWDWWWGGSVWPFAYWWVAQGALLFALVLLWGYVLWCTHFFPEEQRLDFGEPLQEDDDVQATASSKS